MVAPQLSHLKFHSNGEDPQVALVRIEKVARKGSAMGGGHLWMMTPGAAPLSMASQGTRLKGQELKSWS